MDQKQSKAGRRLQLNKGYTLVELMVSFALLALLMTTAVATIAPATKVFSRALNVSRAQNVTNILLDKIAGELSGCLEITTVGAVGEEISYIDKNRIPVRMYLKDGKMYLDYNGGGGTTHSVGEDEKAVTWFFANNVYMGNEITKLQIESMSSRESYVKIQIKVKNIQTGFEYERSKVVQCYNIDSGIE